MTTVDRYLAGYAEIEARRAHAWFASTVTHLYRYGVVVPVRAERANDVTAMLRSLIAAERELLVVLVVNASAKDTAQVYNTNAELIQALHHRAARVHACPTSVPCPTSVQCSPMFLLSGVCVDHRDDDVWANSLKSVDILLIDCGQPHHPLPHEGGVGLARRIGTDVALSLWSQGVVRSSWLSTTHADARVSQDHFDALPVDPCVVAAVRPFWHQVARQGWAASALSLYELQLRYYRLGLDWASAPLAVHTLGSTLFVQARAYAAVRGFPKRQAAEDFYLLNKMAKIGIVATLRGEPVRLLQRLSRRVPLGTGPATLALSEQLRTHYEQGGDWPRWPSASAFAQLRAWMHVLRAKQGNPTEWLEQARAMVPLDRQAGLLRQLEAVVQSAAWRRWQRRYQSGTLVRIEPLEVFDALQALRLLHRLATEPGGSMTWPQALRSAPFAGPFFLSCDADAVSHQAAHQQALRWLESVASPELACSSQALSQWRLLRDVMQRVDVQAGKPVALQE